ncbi:MAG TPA: hypothetical protein VG652_08290 [Gaiellaceae bacterium]|nr:hypothetical protein [Gaiellaceae bacterium]
MSSSSITPTLGHSIRKPVSSTTHAPAVPSTVESVEERRWLLMLGLPFIASASFFAATIGTGALWLLAPAMVLGPALLILAFVYLSITSDSNGD